MSPSRKTVLTIGIEPSLLDFTAPELAAMQLTEEKVRGGMKAEIARLNELGYEAQSLLVDLGETAEAVVKKRLAGQSFDCVLLGAGIRSNPRFFLLFEKLVNAVHEAAPQAKICFNTRPGDTVEAVRRWA